VSNLGLAKIPEDKQTQCAKAQRLHIISAFFLQKCTLKNERSIGWNLADSKKHYE
jgi:hypothetical protein